MLENHPHCDGVGNARKQSSGNSLCHGASECLGIKVPNLHVVFGAMGWLGAGYDLGSHPDDICDCAEGGTRVHTRAEPGTLCPTSFQPHPCQL